MRISAVGGSPVWNDQGKAGWPRPAGEQAARPSARGEALNTAAPEDKTAGLPPVRGKTRAEKDSGIPGREEDAECETCKNRKYQDGSDDSSVSYQSPTKIAPDAVASAVRGHEQEHVSHEQIKAQMEGRRVVSQSVTLHTGVCPECGKVYISGGTTRTVTKEQSDPGELAQRFQVGLPGQKGEKSLSRAV